MGISVTSRRLRVILASKSPRRQDMLRELGIRFEVYVSDVNETIVPRGSAAKMAISLAESKALACPSKDRLVISMDTIVAIDRRKLGKPRDREDAVEMLHCLNNKMHRVVTGVAIRHRNRMVSDSEMTRVYFRKMDAAEIEWYVKSGEPFDKAGAYAIQGLARIFIDRIEGCYYNVIGFPIACFQRLLARLGLSIWDL